MNIIFCGTPACTLPSLNLLQKNSDINLSLIVSMPNRPAGRGNKLVTPPVAQFALDKQIPLLQCENINQSNKFAHFLQYNQVDAIIVFAFAQFFGTKILNSVPCFNIHTSLLPLYRGAAPVQYALLSGDSITGITIQRMVKKMDAGDIAITSKITINPTDNNQTLLIKLQNQIPETLEIFLAQLSAKTLQFTPQVENNATFAPSIPKSMGHVDFVNQTYEQLHNLYRALSPKPGLFCFFDQKRLKIIEIEPSTIKLKPGQTSIKYDMLSIGTKTTAIRLNVVQLEGKKCCDDRSFINGFKQLIPKNIIKGI